MITAACAAASNFDMGSGNPSPDRFFLFGSRYYETGGSELSTSLPAFLFPLLLPTDVASPEALRSPQWRTEAGTVSYTKPFLSSPKLLLSGIYFITTAGKGTKTPLRELSLCSSL